MPEWLSCIPARKVGVGDKDVYLGMHSHQVNNGDECMASRGLFPRAVSDCNLFWPPQVADQTVQ